MKSVFIIASFLFRSNIFAGGENFRVEINVGKVIQ